MWTLFKTMTVVLLAVILFAPILYKLIQIVQRIMALAHEAELNRIACATAWADHRRKQVTWHGPDERGFTGIVSDADTGLYYNTDTGESWSADSPGSNLPDGNRQAIVGKQKLFSSLAGVKVEKQVVQTIAQNGPSRMKVEAETLLHEPTANTAEDVET